MPVNNFFVYTVIYNDTKTLQIQYVNHFLFQSSDHYSGIRESRRVSNNYNNQNVDTTTVPSSQRGDSNTNIPDYQGK